MPTFSSLTELAGLGMSLLYLIATVDISASCEVTLPTPAAGNRIIFKAGGSVSSSVKVSLKSAAAADKIDGAAHNSSPLEALVTPYAAVELVACAGDGLGTIEWFIV